MGYWSYYLVLMGISYAVRYPQLAAGVVVLYLLRNTLPDPWVWLRTSGRMRELSRRVEVNGADVVARRDLARIYLARLRPKRALALLDEARTRHPDDAELLYLIGLSRLKLGQAEAALEPLVRAVQEDPRVGFGDPYLKAGDALMKLARHEDAEDAYEHFVATNSSSLEGYVKLARARAALGRRDQARAATDEALSTFRSLPGFHRRRQLGWWLRAQFARLAT